MKDSGTRKSYGQILALIGVIVAFSGFSSLLVSFDADIFRIDTTVSQAAQLEYDISYDEDALDERQRQAVEQVLSIDIVDQIPEWIGSLVYIPYLIVGGIGVLALFGFARWGRGIGVLVLLGSFAILGVVMAIDMVVPMVIETLMDEEVANRAGITPTYQTGPAISRLRIGSILMLGSSLIALFRPD